MVQLSHTKAFYALDPHLQSAFATLFKSLCPAHQDWWEKKKRSDDHNRTPDGAQTRNLIALFVASMEREDAGRRILFGKHRVRQRIFQLACYLRDCCNKYRYDQPNQNEELADLLLFDELLRELEALTESRPAAAMRCRAELAKQIAALLHDVASIRDIELPPPDDAVVTPAVEREEASKRELVSDLSQVIEAIREARTSTDLTREAIARLRSDFDAFRHDFLVRTPPSSLDEDATSEVIQEKSQGLGLDDWDWEAEGEIEDTGSLTAEEVRSRLVALRRRIWNDLAVGPSTDGALRKRVLDTLIRFRITSHRELEDTLPEAAYIDKRQIPYLSEAFQIVGRME